MDEDIIKKYVRAGDIAWRVKKFIYSSVRPGDNVLQLVNAVENLIRELGGAPAFPVNVSINNVAAHKTPLLDETALTISEGDVVKVDVGVHVDGYIADTAITLCFNDRLLTLVQACKEALEKALRTINVGVRFSTVGGVIDEVARKYGFKPIKNLGGHSLDRFSIHAGDVIPNYSDSLTYGKFRRGYAYAVEPFVSNGKGYVIESNEVNIYALVRGSKFKALSTQEYKLINYILNRFRTLPFCERWLVDLGLELNSLRDILNNLSSKNILRRYNVLVEALTSAYVAQFEETVILADNILVITDPEVKI